MSNDSTSEGRIQPPASNTGVTGKSFCYSIDWLTYSFPLAGLTFVNPKTGEVGFPDGFIHPHEVFTFTGKNPRPYGGYTNAAEMVAGRVDWHASNLKQGGLVNLSGKDCSYAVGSGVDMHDVLDFGLYGARGSITRLDFAVDVFIPGAKAQDIEKAWLEGRVHCSAKSAHPHPEYNSKGELIGYTFYIGSGASERMLRVYNKGIKEGVSGAWIRIELQTRGSHAMAMAQTMLWNGIVEGGKAYLKEFVQVDGVAWFTEALEGPGVDYMEPIERKETDRQRWYREQILPAVRSDLAQGDDWLRMSLQGALDDTEGAGGHGPIVPLENSPKAFKGMQILEHEGFKGADFRHAYEVAGKAFIVQMLERLGYSWSTKKQEWVRL